MRSTLVQILASFQTKRSDGLLQEMGSNLLKKEFCNAVKPQYGWSVDDIPSTYPRVFADKSVR